MAEWRWNNEGGAYSYDGKMDTGTVQQMGEKSVGIGMTGQT
jgi:hypothetical protein